MIEPRVIADEPMEDDEEEMIFEQDPFLNKGGSTFDNPDQETSNVFTRLS